MKVDFGVIGALEEEVSSLIGKLKFKRTIKAGGVDIHVGRLGKRRVAVAKSGVGKVFAALCTEAMIIKTNPSLIINTGVGGALGGGLRTADTVFATSLVQHDMDTSPIGDPVGLISGINKIYFETDARAVQILSRGAAELNIKSKTATVATGDKFIADAADKARIKELFGADVCEMEGAAIAHVAFVNDTPVAVIRAISDSADEGATMDYREFLPVAAKNSAALTEYLIEKY